ncbi:HU domain-containing protein [Pontibacter arcticus]|uniref:SPOR domain-containing protein n=1 Tax=Pontibacter arcticus TaxID=2080288 RepID=A0A364RGB5_9BACT|nr:SPOR domain-containing protein [Pontibacter arcticus]RAU83341.1 SPOR domain-containing protein [Pontibacter arcticus]
MVEKHIKTLLYEHDCVIIPDFGGLITRYVPVQINAVQHTLSPPSKRIAFNEKLTLTDGLLISSIAYRNNITTEEARQLVADFVFQTKAKLEAEKRFELQEIGVFKYNAERRIEFEYVESDNMLEASFGLPEIVARPVRPEESVVLRTLLKETRQEPVHTKLPFRKRLRRYYNIAATLALGGITMTGLYYLSLQSGYDLSSLNPVSYISGNQASANTLQNYTSDVSAEERNAAYQLILPAAEAREVVTESSFFAASESINDSLSIALTESVSTTDKEEVILAEAVKEPIVEKAAEPVLTVSEKTGRFYIVTGGYARLQNAEESRDGILKKGHEAKVIMPLRGSRLYRVSVADFATDAEAKDALRTYRKSFGETIWVLNN